MSKGWVVRWWLNDTDAEKFSLMIEQLRYAGLVRVHGHPLGGVPRIIDLLCPAGVTDTKTWAEQKSGRMGSFTLITRAVEANSKPEVLCPKCGGSGSDVSKYPITGCSRCEGDGRVPSHD